MQLKSIDFDTRGTHIVIFKLFHTVFIVKEHFQFFGKVFNKMLKMDKFHLFSPNYVCIMMGNETK